MCKTRLMVRSITGQVHIHETSTGLLEEVQTCQPDCYGKLPTYQPENNGEVQTMQPDCYGEIPTCQPENNGEVPTYQPDCYGELPTYQPENNGEAPTTNRTVTGSTNDSVERTASVFGVE
jgi:hypothetical protein